MSNLALSLLIATLLVHGSVQVLRAYEKRQQLLELQAQQGPLIDEARAVALQLESIVRDMTLLAKQGNAVATELLVKLQDAGVRLRNEVPDTSETKVGNE